jgi:DNA-binding MarR family transcriptional regulator
MTTPDDKDGKKRKSDASPHSLDCVRAFLNLHDQHRATREAVHSWFERQAEWRVLCSLALAANEERSSDITTIVADSGMPRSTVKRVIDLLVERGDIQLERSHNDRRRLMVIPSDRLIEEVLSVIDEMIDRTFGFATRYGDPATDN